MKKFEIIEEGRLSKSEMNQITGGLIIGCTGVYILTSCENKKGGTVVSCEKDYTNDGTGTLCKTNYVGAPMLVPEDDDSPTTNIGNLEPPTSGGNFGRP